MLIKYQSWNIKRVWEAWLLLPHFVGILNVVLGTFEVYERPFVYEWCPMMVFRRERLYWYYLLFYDGLKLKYFNSFLYGVRWQPSIVTVCTDIMYARTVVHNCTRLFVTFHACLYRFICSIVIVCLLLNICDNLCVLNHFSHRLVCERAFVFHPPFVVLMYVFVVSPLSWFLLSFTFVFFGVTLFVFLSLGCSFNSFTPWKSSFWPTNTKWRNIWRSIFCVC